MTDTSNRGYPFDQAILGRLKKVEDMCRVLITRVQNAGAVTSVFTRTGAVVAATNDYTWAQVDKTTSSLGDITTRSASDLSSGTVPTARLGSGTADSTTFLRGDQTWATPTDNGVTWTTLATESAPSGGTITFDSLAAYKEYRVISDNAVASAAVAFGIELNDNAGTHSNIRAYNTNTVDTSATRLLQNLAVNTSASFFAAEIYNDGTDKVWGLGFNDTSPGMLMGVSALTAQITKIELVLASGNWSSGDIRVQGRN